MARLWRHGAEGVRAAGGEGVDADEQHVHQQRPGVAVGQEVQGGAEDEETPQEIPGTQKQLVSFLCDDQSRPGAASPSVPRSARLLCLAFPDILDLSRVYFDSGLSGGGQCIDFFPPI